MSANLATCTKATRVANAQAAGQTTVNSSSIDMAGFSSAIFVVAMGAITAGAATACKLQGSDDDTNWSDLYGTSQSVPDDGDNKLYLMEIPKPRHRYLRAVVTRATQDSVVDAIVAVQSNASTLPTTHDSSVGGSWVTASPAAS